MFQTMAPGKPYPAALVSVKHSQLKNPEENYPLYDDKLNIKFTIQQTKKDQERQTDQNRHIMTTEGGINQNKTDEEMTKMIREEIQQNADQNQQPAQKNGKKKFSQGFMALIERKQKQMQLEQEMANMVAAELKEQAEDT